MMGQDAPSMWFLRTLRRQFATASVLACGTLLLLSGCGIPRLHHAEKAAPLPGDFNGAASPDSAAQIGVDEFFGDPVLTQLIAQGLAFNQELKIRNQEVQIASNEVLLRRGAYLPFISLRGRGSVDRNSRFTPLGAAEDQLTYPGGGNFPDPLPNALLSADLNWRVDIWRELRNARDAAIQRYVEAVERRDFFITRLVAEVAENYYELAALDKRLVFLNQTIEVQQRSQEVAEAQKAAARGTELAVQRFLAEVRKNESQRLIITQRIIEVENRINFLVGRYPQMVDRGSWDYINLDARMLSVGVPAQLLLNRRDIQAAEREISAAGLDVAAARARFFPRLDITARVGTEAFNPRYLFDPGALIASAAGDVIAPLINKKAIQADYLTANARQLQAVYDYQRTVLNAFIEVVNSITKVENYRRSVEIKQYQVRALESSVSVAGDLFQNARAEYVDVLFSQRDLLEARTALIETKQEQLTAIVRAYQALGGGLVLSNAGKPFAELLCPQPMYRPQQLGPPMAPEAESVPLPPADPNALPPPGDTNMPPATGNVPKPPVLSNAGRLAPPQHPPAGNFPSTTVEELY